MNWSSPNSLVYQGSSNGKIVAVVSLVKGKWRVVTFDKGAHVLQPEDFDSADLARHAAELVVGSLQLS